MTDPVPPKDQLAHWREITDGRYETLLASAAREMVDEIVRLREDCRRWENARNVWMAEEKRLKAQVEELSIHAEKWVKRALGGDRASVLANPVTEPETFVVTAGQVTHYVQPPSRYTIEPHGDAHALYFGRDHMHHGFNLARITEATPETLQLIERALNAGAAPEPQAARNFTPEEARAYKAFIEDYFGTSQPPRDGQ